MNQVMIIGSAEVFLPFASIILTGIAVLIGLNCIWRVEHRLKVFIKLMTLAIILIGARKILGLLGYNETPAWSQILLYFDLAVSVVFVFSFGEMYRIIRILNREKNKK